MATPALLEAQLDEIEALLSMFPDEGSVTFSAREQETLVAARERQAAATGRAPTPFEGEISGRVCLPDTDLEGQPVHLVFQLPPDYPVAACQLRIDCAVSRGMVDAMLVKLADFAQQHAGQEHLLLCVDFARTEVLELLDAGLVCADASGAEAPVQHERHADKPPVLKHTVVWFHHIKSTKKRKSIAEWSGELCVGGYAKLGYPGVIVLEGQQGDVDEFVVRLRNQHWKAMAVRGEVTEICEDLDTLSAMRKWHGRIEEIADLGTLADHCKAAGLESLFLTALKIEK